MGNWDAHFLEAMVAISKGIKCWPDQMQRRAFQAEGMRQAKLGGREQLGVRGIVNNSGLGKETWRGDMERLAGAWLRRVQGKQSTWDFILQELMRGGRVFDRFEIGILCVCEFVLFRGRFQSIIMLLHNICITFFFAKLFTF